MVITTTLLVCHFPARAADHTVKKDGTGNFTTIQACASAARAGDNCLVYPGVYDEHVKTTTGGADTTYRVSFIAQGAVTMQGFDIKHPYVTVQGFDITGYSGGYTGLITVYTGGDNCLLLNNTLRDGAVATYGIYFMPSGAGANHCIARGNTITNLRSNMITTWGRDHLFENNRLSVNNLQDFFRTFGNGHVFRRNIVKNATTGTTGSHPDIVQVFGGAGIEAQNMLFEENWFENLRAGTQLGQLNGGDGIVWNGVLYENVRNITFRRNVFIDIDANITVAVPGFTYESNTFYRAATAANGIILSGSLVRGEFKNATIKNNVMLAGGSGSPTSGFYSVSGMAFGREAIAIKVTGEPNGAYPNAQAIEADLRAKGYISASDSNILQPSRNLANISWFNLDPSLEQWKPRVYEYLTLTASMDVQARATFYANHNFVAGPAPTFAAKATSSCSLQTSNFCETNGINGGDPQFASLVDFDGPDDTPFTIDDGLKPLPTSPLCGKGEGGADIGAYSCDPSKVFPAEPSPPGNLRAIAK